MPLEWLLAMYRFRKVWKIPNHQTHHNFVCMYTVHIEKFITILKVLLEQ